MNRKLSAYALPTATVLAAALLALAPALGAQTKCYPSYVTLSGTCPDSCGRGDECPCETCVIPPPAT